MDKNWVRQITWLLIGTALVWHTVRCAFVTGGDQLTPFLSANDRSRWCTVRALVDLGTYEIDDVILQKGWNTIDKVYHRGHDGEPHYYSSKPPLYSTMLAVPYALVKNITGWTLGDRPFLVGRLLIWFVNGAFLLIFFWSMWGLAERFCENEWAYLFVMGTVTWATFLTTFSITINNHLPAAAMTAAALRGFLQIWLRGRQDWLAFATVGCTAALAATFELPALCFCVLVVGALLVMFPIRTLVASLPPAAIVIAAFFVTNWEAHDTLAMAYSQRTEGADWESGNWYNYPGSYWLAENRKGVDQGEPSLLRYAFHVLIGHHGIWSLSPVWLLSLAGLAMWPSRLGGLTVGGLILTCLLAVILFYLSREVGDRNYGGMTSGFRWSFWLTPLLAVGMIPLLNAYSQYRWFRRLCLFLLFSSSFSILYPVWNPWQHPWLYDVYINALANVAASS